MTELYILDRNFNLLGVIDEYVSIIWRPSYSEVGDFEIYLGATEKAVDLLKENRYVVRSSDVTVDANGNTTYKKVMIIKNQHIVTDVENGDFLTVTGKELKYILNQRVVWNQTTLTGTAENAIRRLVNENAITTDTNRVIPNLILGNSSNLTDTIEKQVTGDKLDVVITEICTTCNFGWDIYIYNTHLVFIVYQGTDRSYAQTDRPYVVFSEDFENLYNTEYELNTENYGNTALVGGQGEGLKRFYTTVNDTNTGLGRYEIFVDAKSISKTEKDGDTEKELSDNAYSALLQTEGKAKLAEAAYTEGFTGELLSDVAFIYEKDFYLGDLVTVINKYGLTKDVRVMSAIESEDDSGSKLVPQFNI